MLSPVFGDILEMKEEGCDLLLQVLLGEKNPQNINIFKGRLMPDLPGANGGVDRGKNAGGPGPCPRQTAPRGASRARCQV